jgi:putative integral membrane protein (TIGR02587 family)
MTSAAATAGDDRSQWRRELLDVARAASGGLVFGVPLLYTMEVWWIGSHTEPHEMLLVLGLLLVPLMALNMTAGFRTVRQVRAADALGDSVEALAIGIVVTTLVLVVLRQITWDTPPSVVLGRVVNECIPFCLGIGVARFVLEGDPGMADDENDDDGLAADGTTEHRELNSNAADVGATALGAAFIGLSIAPTDEVPMLASAMTPAWQVLVVIASLVVSYVIVFVAGFSGQDRRHRQEGVFQHPLTETLVTYLVALGVAAALLATFQRELSPPPTLLAHVVVLGFPAAVGGAIGRLAI